MKRRALAAMLLLCLCSLTLSGCWQEDLSEQESRNQYGLYLHPARRRHLLRWIRSDRC